MHQLPLVTVYIPTCNRVELLKRAVNSVLRQTYRNIELIIVDDNSSDSTVNYLIDLASQDPRVRYIVNEENFGASVSRNKAIMKADGKFITGLDDDDYVTENHIEVLFKKWNERGPKTVAIYPNILRKIKFGIKKAHPKIKKCLPKYLICSNWIGNQIFTEVEYILASGGFNEDLQAWQDIDCWYRLLSLENGEAECSVEYTYIVDWAHGHVRISESNYKKIFRSWELYCESNGFEETERQVSRLMLVHYEKYIPSPKMLMKKIFYMPKLINLRHAFILVYVGFLEAYIVDRGNK